MLISAFQFLNTSNGKKPTYVTTCKERKKERKRGGVVEGVINSGQIWLFDGVTLAKQ